jgi:hypothetical protein
MNYSDRFLRETASYSVLDILLADIAVRIQLSPTDLRCQRERNCGALHEGLSNAVRAGRTIVKSSYSSAICEPIKLIKPEHHDDST